MSRLLTAISSQNRRQRCWRLVHDPQSGIILYILIANARAGALTKLNSRERRVSYEPPHGPPGTSIALLSTM
jgi:hypothetical protein